MQFALLLARTLGRTLAELGSMTAKEFALWQAEYLARPWGEERADLRAGIIASTVANYAGKQRAENAGLAVPKDFMPFKREAEPERTEDDDPTAFFRRL